MEEQLAWFGTWAKTGNQDEEKQADKQTNKQGKPASEMTWWVKIPAPTPDDLSPTPRSTLENRLLS